MKLFKSLYAEVEREGEGYATFNLVTGLCIGEYATLAEANGQAHLIHLHYAGLAKQSNFVR